MSWNMWVTGNEATGKTTFSRFLRPYLRAYGAIEKDLFVEYAAMDLISAGPKATSVVRQAFVDAAGGVLFIDNAHELIPSDEVDDDACKRVTKVLLTEMQKAMGLTVVVLAGKKEGLTTFMHSDQGLMSRFRFHIHISDFSPDELVQIIEKRATAMGFQFEEELPSKIIKHIQDGRGATNVTKAKSMVERAMQNSRDRLFRQFHATSDASTADFGQLGPELLKSATSRTSAASVLTGKQRVVLYFSAHWCPPCRSLTPQLAQTYLAKGDGSIAVVFVSADKDQKSFEEYYTEMPWLAVPFTSKKIRDDLSATYNVSGLPSLVVLDENGAKITSLTGGGSKALDAFDRLFAPGTSAKATSAPFVSSTSSKILIATDFGIGVKIGADDEVKSLIDREVEKLVGMTAAKEWCNPVLPARVARLFR
jgi:thiol-disulfide isomerase/thioredoxin